VTSAIVEGYGRRRYKADFIKFLINAQSECDEIILHLDFLFETESFKDAKAYAQFKIEYEALSKRINTFIQWVENNWNNFDKPEAGN
jgi:four helix bundle protein